MNTNSNPWRDYVGNYEKIEYDLLLKNGSVVYNCWPNAGEFSELLGSRIIRGEEIFRFRESEPTSYEIIESKNDFNY